MSSHVPVHTTRTSQTSQQGFTLTESAQVGTLCSSFTRKDHLDSPPFLSTAQANGQLNIRPIVEYKGAASDTKFQALVLCAFNTFFFSFPLCSLNRIKFFFFFCKAPFVAFCLPFVFIMFLISSLRRNSLHLYLPIRLDAF